LRISSSRKVYLTTLEFIGDAICLSGLTGTKLKCDVIGFYYPFWWKITSGGKSENYLKTTSIVELNAATGEVYIKDAKETVLGSAGHALQLKTKHLDDQEVDTQNLKVILVENDKQCHSHLKKVIHRRWPNVSLEKAADSSGTNSSNIFLFNDTLDEALEKIDEIELGNTIYYFDPLRSVQWDSIEKVAHSRMKSFFQTGTEFIIFVFTSDWFLGRGEDLAALPSSPAESSWTEGEAESVAEADSLFGDQEWRKHVLNKNTLEEREQIFIRLYKNRLHRWFRYVLPMPFRPKENQLFHLILCSNYEAGVAATKKIYVWKTFNRPYSPSNQEAFSKFKALYPETFANLSRRKRPLQWLLLWKIIKQHEEGICDCYCKDFKENETDMEIVESSLKWLLGSGYLRSFSVKNAWGFSAERYKIDWKSVKAKLGVNAPPKLRPITPEEFAEAEFLKSLEGL
jgi:three-Cys-motif partner protein